MTIKKNSKFHSNFEMLTTTQKVREKKLYHFLYQIINHLGFGIENLGFNFPAACSEKLLYSKFKMNIYNEIFFKNTA